jgi:WXG100 family type VII secretion target
MADILVRPPELRQAASQMRDSANKIGQALQDIDSDLQALKGNKFLGNRANAVQLLYQSKRDALEKAKDLVSQFAFDLEKAADVFEKADKDGIAQSPMTSEIKGSPQGGSFPLAGMNFYKAGKNLLEYLVDIRLNDLAGKGAGIVAGAGVGVFFGTFDDVINNTYDSDLEAGGVNLINGLVTIAISKNSYGLLALGISGAVQIGGNLMLGLDRLQNDFFSADNVTRELMLNQSSIKSESLDKMDLGNITKSFSESICDGFLFTDKGREGMLNTAKSAVGVVDGIVEFRVNDSFSSISKTVMFTDRAIQESPFLSEKIKVASTSISHQALNIVSDKMRRVVNIFEWK